MPQKEYLPAGIVGDDVDLYVAAEDFSTAIDICKRTGVHGYAKQPKKRLMRLAYQAVQNPSKAVRLVATSPGRVYQLLREQNEGGDGSSEFVVLEH